MSQPANVATTVTETDTGAAAQNLVESADNHSPETPTPDPVPAAPDPVDGDNGREAAGDIIKALAQRVETLEGAVREIAKPDEPARRKRPWTQRGRREP